MTVLGIILFLIVIAEIYIWSKVIEQREVLMEIMQIIVESSRRGEDGKDED